MPQSRGSRHLGSGFAQRLPSCLTKWQCGALFSPAARPSSSWPPPWTRSRWRRPRSRAASRLVPVRRFAWGLSLLPRTTAGPSSERSVCLAFRVSGWGLGGEGLGRGEGSWFRVEGLGRGEGFRDWGLEDGWGPNGRLTQVSVLVRIHFIIVMIGWTGPSLNPHAGLGAAAVVGVRKKADGGVYSDSPDLSGKKVFEAHSLLYHSA